MIRNLLLASVLALTVVGCKSETQKRAEVFSNTISSSTGVTYQLVKANTETSGYAVFKNLQTGEHVAFNMNKFDRKNGMTYEQYSALAVAGVDIVNNLRREDRWIQSGYWEDIVATRYRDEYDTFCRCYVSRPYDVVVGERFVDTSHWATFYLGGGFLFDTSATASKDLETMMSLSETAQKKIVSDRLQSEFSLSANRAEELAKVASRYLKLESNRELTESEKSLLTTEAFGVRHSEIENAMRAKTQGRDEAYKAMLRKAAEVNRTTPENMGEIFKEFEAL